MHEIIEKIIKVLVIKRNNPLINYAFFMDQLTSWFESNREQVEVRNAEDFRLSAIPVLKKMEAEGSCSINYESSRIVSFQIHKYYRQLVMKYYKNLEDRPDIPFPDLRSFSFTIDTNWIMVFNIQSNFMKIFEFPDAEKGKVAIIEFQEGISDIVVPPEILKTAFFDLVLKKIHLYIQNQNNYAYLGRYLRKAFEGNEMAVKSMMESLLSGPANFRDHIKRPADFAFKFFSFLCNKVLKDLADKNDKTAADIYTYQSMSMLRSFITYGRALVQQDVQKKNDLRDLASKVKKPPFIFSSSEMYEITDNAGKPYSTKYSREFVTDFIKTAVTVKEDEDLPYLVKVSVDSKKDYYIQRDMVPQVFLKKLIENSKEIREKYYQEWSEILRKFKKNREMQHDSDFIASLTALVKSDYKLLNALLNPGLIYLANKTEKANSRIKMSVESCFADPGKFKSIDVLLGIDRQDLLRQVRASLPIHYSLPVIGKLIAALSALFMGKKKSEPGSPGQVGTSQGPVDEVFQEFGEGSRQAPVKQQAGEKTPQSPDYQAAIKTLKSKFLKGDQALNPTLDELAEKWNPLYDKTARENLVEDINSLVRDFMRRKKKLLLRYPPDVKRIASLTDDLVNKTSKIGIKKREPFRNYIELYIIKLLENIKSL
ncbi:MAG: hypothetical protein RBT69_12555 [Spirochaetia bacterium]|jgi:hypothetical protein|nr:hypothetical protein [Spirochaetia bacterium]